MNEDRERTNAREDMAAETIPTRSKPATPVKESKRLCAGGEEAYAKGPVVSKLTNRIYF